MASTTSHTIALQGALVRREALAHEAITPGQLLEINTDEEAAKHSAASGVVPGKLVALESPTAAAGTTEAIDVAYATGDTVYIAVGQPGDVYYMWLKAGESAVKGITQMASDGAGALIAKTVDANTLENSIVGIADEDKTAGGGVAVRLRVMIV
jgi:hypothetical protein